MSDSYLCHFVTPSKVHSCYNKSILKKKKNPKASKMNETSDKAFVIPFISTGTLFREHGGLTREKHAKQ